MAVWGWWPPPAPKPGPCHCEHLTEQLTAIRQQLNRIEHQETKMTVALDNLKAADQALKDEVVTFLQDIAAKLAAEDPDIQAVADDVNAQVSALQGADTP